MEEDLLVVTRDPLFGGGSQAQTEAFLAAATALGRTPRIVFDPHPGLRGPRLTWRRIEAVRQVAATRTRLPLGASIWVVSTHATDGGSAAASGRGYSCWIGTTLDSEWRGRATSMARGRRLAAAVSLSALRRLERRVLRGAVRLYATSAASRADVSSAADRDDVGILPIPVDVARFVPEPEETWRRTLAQPTIAFVGRADDPRKNIGLLLDAARRLDGVRVRLIGRPPRCTLPPNVDAVGIVSDVAEALRGSTLFVLTSRQEGFGIVAAEALAAGLPVVTTPSGGPEELIRKSGGGRVLSGFEVEELATTLRQLLQRTDALAEIRCAGRSYVEQNHAPAVFERRVAQALNELDD